MKTSKIFRLMLVSYLSLEMALPASIFGSIAYAGQEEVSQSESSGTGGSPLSESGAFAQDIIGGGSAGAGLINAGKSIGQFSEGSPSGHGSEYVSGAYKGAVLIPVSILGAIPKPGVHHIPTRTNLLKLLTLAGGPLETAKLSELVIKRLKSDDTKEEVQEEIFKIDAEELLTTSGERGPLLRAGDVVYIPAKKPLIDSNTMQVVAIISAILGVAVTATVLSDRRR